MSELVRTSGTDFPSDPWHFLFDGECRNYHHTTLAEKSAAKAAEKENGK